MMQLNNRHCNSFILIWLICILLDSSHYFHNYLSNLLFYVTQHGLRRGIFKINIQCNFDEMQNFFIGVYNIGISFYFFGWYCVSPHFLHTHACSQVMSLLRFTHAQWDTQWCHITLRRRNTYWRHSTRTDLGDPVTDNLEGSRVVNTLINSTKKIRREEGWVRWLCLRCSHLWFWTYSYDEWSLVYGTHHISRVCELCNIAWIPSHGFPAIYSSGHSPLYIYICSYVRQSYCSRSAGRMSSM